MPIRDQHKYRKLEAELRQIKTLRYLRPFLWLLGSRGREASRAIEEALGKIPEMEVQLERLRNTPDEFNQLYWDHGWIASDDFNQEAMEEAVRIGKEEGIDEGEEYLVAYFSHEQIARWLRIFCFIPFMEPRRDLLWAAFEDHKAKRFHASVPVVLAQVDGITYDLAHQTFYEGRRKKTKHLEATETIVGDPDGLAALAELLSVPRGKTSEDPIGIPYRHGILHGRDLGYANQAVSTKAFALLLSLRPWVLKVINEEQFTEPPIDYFDPREATWDDVKQQWSQLLEALDEYNQTRRAPDQAEE